jgi:hypothetical protein
MANYVTNGGLAGITTALSSIVTYLAVGTSATDPAKTDTALGAVVTGYGLDAGAATVSTPTTTVTGDTISLTKTWTVTTGTKALAEIGAQTSGGTLYAHALLSSVKNVGIGDTFTGTLNLIFTN